MNRKILFLSLLSSSIFLVSCGSEKDSAASNSANENNSNTHIKVTNTPKLISNLEDFKFKSIAVIDNGFYGVDLNGNVILYNKDSYPKKISGLSDVKIISSNSNTTCALTNAGQALCFGRNIEGELGNNSNINSDDPVLVKQNEGSAGATFYDLIVSKSGLVCARSGGNSSGYIYCWGKNGDRFNGLIKDSNYPLMIPHILSSEIISVGDDYVCEYGGINVHCFNSYLQIIYPDNLLGGPIKSMSSSGANTCAVTSTGSAYCWGKNNFGQLGDGSNIDCDKPVRVKIVANFQSISVSESTVCGITKNNEAYCWGRGDESQLGSGTLKNSNIPVKVSSINYFSSIKTSEHNTCAIDINSKIWCWGLGEWN